MNKRQKNNNQSKQNGGFEEEVISVDRISRMTAGGRRMRFRAVVAYGNKKDKLGIGIAKATDVSQAIEKAKRQADKNLIDVPIIEGTIPHKTMIEYSGAKILLKPAAPGTGIIAGGVVRKALELGGVENVLSKSFGSQNKINNLKAVRKALVELSETLNKKDE